MKVALGRAAVSTPIVCRASPLQPTHVERVKLVGVAGLLAGCVCLCPLDAMAVSGGGGISNALSGMDFSGQDLTKNSYTKAVIRQTNFSNCNLE